MGSRSRETIHAPVALRALVWLPALLVSLLPVPRLLGAECPSDTEARRLLTDGRYAEAATAARALIASAEQSHGPDSFEVGCALIDLVESLNRAGKGSDPETTDLGRRAVAILETSAGPGETLARSMRNLAMTREYSGDLAASRQILERALSMGEEALGSEHADVGRTHANLGWTLYLLAEYDPARSHLERAREILEKALGPEDLNLAGALNNLANLCWRTGRYEEARSFHERALAIREKKLPPDHPLVARSVENLAIVLQQMGEYAAARPLYERALGIRERSLGLEHPDVANNMQNYAALLTRLGDAEGARRLYERALPILEKAYGPERREVALALSNLAGALSDLGACQEALERAKRSIAIFEKSMGPDHPDSADGWNALGSARRCSEDTDGAIAAYERMLEILEKKHGPDHPKNALVLKRLSDLQVIRGDADRALALSERALAISRQSLGPDHPEIARLLARIAEIGWIRGDPGGALSHARQAADLTLDHVRQTLSSLPERQALLLIQSRAHPEVILFSGLLAHGSDQPGWMDAAWDWTLKRRGIVLEELAARHRAAEAGSSEESRAAWERLSRAREAMASLWVRASRRTDKDLIEALAGAREEKERAEADLARVSARFRRVLEIRAVSRAEVQSHLPERSAVAEIVRVEIRPPRAARGEPHDVALILRSDGGTVSLDLGLSSAVDASVAAWRQALDETASWIDGADGARRINRRLNGPGSRLREIVWDPIAGAAGDVDTIFLVPDGALHGVDLKALPAPAGGYLVERRPAVHHLGSARDLVRLSEAGSRKNGHGALVLGAPDFDAASTARLARLPQGPAGTAYRGKPSSCRSLWETRWSPLPRSAREARRVDHLVAADGPVVLLTGAAASEERFKREAPGKSLLHLATHGFFLQEQCASSPAKSESRAPAAATASGEAASENPLLQSGLVLAGANHLPEADERGEDGILTAEELAALDLSGVDLAVLSACDTGRGAVELGEGVFGLRRAIELAEVRSVVMSLWRVPDRQALDWMTTFYGKRARGRPLLAAAQEASLASLKALRDQDRPTHPYLWAGFITAGDWR